MRFHKEGNATAIVSFIFLASLVVVLLLVLPSIFWLQLALIIVPLVFYFRILYFFRVPRRTFQRTEQTILAPADGEIVAIEQVFEPEYLKAECLQISVFMSPWDVHINWYPTDGEVSYQKYHPGKHLVAWHPKSSTLNERTSVGMKIGNGQEILVRQIAGAVARRIVCYAKPKMKVEQNQELGFIKFGSRVDVFLPLDVDVKVQLNDKVVGGVTPLAGLH